MAHFFKKPNQSGSGLGWTAQNFVRLCNTKIGLPKFETLEGNLSRQSIKSFGKFKELNLPDIRCLVSGPRAGKSLCLDG